MALRKKKKNGKDNKDDLESLLVFGYQSKIFRDDERAMFVDRGQHLIPWMGDSSIMIDRSVVRGGNDIKGFDFKFDFINHLIPFQHFTGKMLLTCGAIG